MWGHWRAVRLVCKRLGWTEVGDDQECDLFWTDTSINEERLLQLRGVQARIACSLARFWDASSNALLFHKTQLLLLLLLLLSNMAPSLGRERQILGRIDAAGLRCAHCGPRNVAGSWE